MRFANTENGFRICAEDASRDQECFCPTCNAPVILKKGQIVLPYFAHLPNRSCTDAWKYDITPWVQKQQQKYPAGTQEVIIEHSNQKHHADVAVGDYVILFIHEHITNKHFIEKTRYFQKAGKTVLWVIDAEEEFKIRMLRHNPRDRGMMFWDHPPVFLKKVDLKADRNMFIFLSVGHKQLLKVEWVMPESNFERFLIDADFAPDLSTEEGCRIATLSKYKRFDEFKANNMPWHKKASKAVQVRDERWRMCDKTGKSHEDQCRHCPHNLINEFRAENKRTGAKGGLYYYCKYPYEVSPVVTGENGEMQAVVPEITLK